MCPYSLRSVFFRLITPGAVFLLAFLAGGETRAADIKVNALNINTDADEDKPFFNQGLSAGVPGRLFFSRKAPSGKWDLWWAKYEAKKKALGPAELIGPQAQTNEDDLGAVATPEGRFPQYLLFTTKKDKLSPSTDIYITLREGASNPSLEKAFGPLRAIEAIATKEDEYDPWLQVSGPKSIQLFFTRKTKDGPRIHLSLGEVLGKGSLAVFGQGKVIDSLPVGFTHPTLFTDGKRMILQGPVKGGRQGVFVSQFASGQWSTPQPVAALDFADSRVGTVSPSLTRDGKTLYFATDRPGGKGGLDIYYVSVADLNLPK